MWGFFLLLLFCGACNSHYGISCRAKGRNAFKKEPPNCDKLSEGFRCGAIPCFPVKSSLEVGWWSVFLISEVQAQKKQIFLQRRESIIFH